MQIKTTMRYYIMLTRLAKILKFDNNTKYWKGCGAMEIQYWRENKLVQEL